MKKFIYIVLFIGILTAFLSPVNTVAQNNNNIESPEKFYDPIFKIFDNEYDANEYYNLMVKKTTHVGKHLQIDGDKNKYYWTNNDDIGNISDGGYGDFKTFYKNGEIWKFNYKGKSVVDTVQFQVLDKSYEKIPKNTVLFCVEPLEMAEWIHDADDNQSQYNKLSSQQKKDVNSSVSFAISLFSKTGNFDYLSAGQMMVWESIGATNIMLPPSIEKEWSDLHRSKASEFVKPSFLNDEIALKYDNEKQNYNIELVDTNNVLDEKYLDDFIGDYDGFHVEDGLKENDLYIWRKDYTKETSPEIKGEWDPMPNNSGEKYNVHYENLPIFINSGQDLVTGMTNIQNVLFDCNVKELMGRIEFYKYGENENIEDIIPLENIEFTLYDQLGNIIQSQTSDMNGRVVFSNVPLGSYYVKETKTLPGYVLSDKKIDILLTENQNNVVFEADKPIVNYKIRGKIYLKKIGVYNKEKEALSGAQFNIYEDINNNQKLDQDEISNNLEQILYTDKKGEILSDELEYGSYIIREEKAPQGYINNGYQENFFIENNNQIIDLNNNKPIENTKIVGFVDLFKINNYNQKLKDAEFTIYSNKNNNEKIDVGDKKIQKIVTDENGYAKSDKLPYGNYILKETKAPINHKLNNENFKFSIEKNNEIEHINNSEPIVDQKHNIMAYDKFVRTGGKILKIIVLSMLMLFLSIGIIYKKILKKNDNKNYI